jgi:hypothetical protein
MEIQDGIIKINSPAAKEFGFTTEHFTGDSYLWKMEDAIFVSLIESKTPGNGSLRTLFETIEKKNFTIVVPTPMRRMYEILVKNGFQPTRSEDGCELWYKEPGYKNEK